MLRRKMKLLFSLAHLILMKTMISTQASYAIAEQKNDTRMDCIDGLLISDHVCLPAQYDKRKAPEKKCVDHNRF